MRHVLAQIEGDTTRRLFLIDFCTRDIHGDHKTATAAMPVSNAAEDEFRPRILPLLQRAVGHVTKAAVA